MNQTSVAVSSRVRSIVLRGRLCGALAFAGAIAALTLGACSSDEGPGQVAGNGSSGTAGSSGTPGTDSGTSSSSSSSSSSTSSSGGGGPMQDACISVQHEGVEFGYNERAYVHFSAGCQTAHSKVQAATEAGAEIVGSCWFRPLVDGGNDFGSTSPSAGTIIMVGQDPENEPYVVAFGDGYFPFAMTPMFDGESETSIAVSASGAEVPAFSGSLRIAGRTPLTLPQGAAVDGLTVKRSADTVLTWPPTSAGRRVVFHATQTVDPDQSTDKRTVTCEFDGTLGTGTVPKEMLAHLNAEKLDFDEVTLQVEDHTVVVAGRFQVTLEGTQALLGTDSKSYSGAALNITE